MTLSSRRRRAAPLSILNACFRPSKRFRQRVVLAFVVSATALMILLLNKQLVVVQTMRELDAASKVLSGERESQTRRQPLVVTRPLSRRSNFTRDILAEDPSRAQRVNSLDQFPYESGIMAHRSRVLANHSGRHLYNRSASYNAKKLALIEERRRKKQWLPPFFDYGDHNSTTESSFPGNATHPNCLVVYHIPKTVSSW
jgi:hypothetical protein